MPVITNTLGFLALLGIPAVLLIHFLQRRAKVVPCSTLFLLRQTQRESTSGRKFDRLINSLALWMQLLVVLLITFLLVQPRYIKKQSTQRIAIVLDSSASMGAFKQEAVDKLLSILPELQGSASSYELWVLDSTLSKDRIYHGSNSEELRNSLTNWSPQSGTTDPNHVLRVARSLVGQKGSLVYLTDTPQQSCPYNGSVVSIGKAIPNVGFTGVQFLEKDGQIIWQASVRNYAKEDVQRTWNFRTDQLVETAPTPIQLAPGELKVLQGSFPKNTLRLEIKLSPDAFPQDDTLPLIRSQSKQLAILNEATEAHNAFSSKCLTSFDNLSKATTKESSDLILRSLPADAENFPELPSIVLLDTSQQKNERKYVVGNIISSENELTEGLNWKKLLVSEEERFQLGKRDTALVWLDQTPLLFLREVPLGFGKSHTQLVFNFDIAHSNALQQEAVALLVYRFLESQRQQKQSLQHLVTELSQPLDIGQNKEGNDITITTTDLTGKELENSSQKASLRVNSPDKIGFYTIQQDGTPLLHGSNYFADTREADLSKCEEGYLEAKTDAEAIDQHSQEDHYWRVWVLLALLALLLSWQQPNRLPS